RLRCDARVGGVNAVDIRIDVAERGIQSSGNGHSRGIRSAATQGRDPALLVHALKAGHDRNLTRIHGFHEVGVVAAGDARLAVRLVRPELELPSEPGPGL